MAVACEVTGIDAKTLKERIEIVDADLSRRWYDSGETDYSLYSVPEYDVSLLHCWRYGGTSYASSNVTRLFMRWLAHRDLKPKTFIDYHGGLGLTAAQLAMGHPDAEVFFHTVVKHHAEMGKEIFKRLNLKNIVIIDEVCRADALLAQETMEHFSDPITEIKNVIDAVKPRFYLDQSSFTIDACGHFKHNKKIAKPFNEALREMGYETYWCRENIRAPFNSKPTVWVK